MTTFMGHELPPLREGNVWAMQIYVGGRKVVKQVKPERIDHIRDALEKLKTGLYVYVRLDDAVEVLQRADLAQAQARSTAKG